MATTTALVHGVNPYAFDVQPQYSNLYGIVYPLIIWPLAKVWGAGIVLHRIISGVFILASCGIIFWVLRYRKVPVYWSLWATMMLYASLLFPKTSSPVIDSASTGMFFMLLAIFIPYRLKYSHQALLLSIIFGIIAFYTKPYFLVAIPLIGTYLFLFISRIKSIVYGAIFVVLMLLSVLVVNELLPAYFDNCFFSQYNFVVDNLLSFQRLFEQLRIYSYIHLPTLLVFGGYLFYILSKWVERGRWRENLVLKEFKSLQFNNFNMPLIRKSVAIDVYAVVFIGFVLIFLLGRNSGAMLWYFFQLLSPFLLISVTSLVVSLNLSFLVTVPFYVVSLLLIAHGHRFDSNRQGWYEVQQALSNYNHILGSSIIAPMLIEANREIFDDGHSEYFLCGAKRHVLLKNFFKEDDRVYVAVSRYFNKISNMIKQQEFDIIMILGIPQRIREVIDQHYVYKGELEVYAPQDQRSYLMKVWIPSRLIIKGQ